MDKYCTIVKTNQKIFIKRNRRSRGTNHGGDTKKVVSSTTGNNTTSPKNEITKYLNVIIKPQTSPTSLKSTKAEVENDEKIDVGFDAPISFNLNNSNNPDHYSNYQQFVDPFKIYISFGEQTRDRVDWKSFLYEYSVEPPLNQRGSSKKKKGSNINSNIKSKTKGNIDRVVLETSQSLPQKKVKTTHNTSPTTSASSSSIKTTTTTTTTEATLYNPSPTFKEIHQPIVKNNNNDNKENNQNSNNVQMYKMVLSDILSKSKNVNN